MRQFMMKGNAITGAKRFQASFSPQQLLRQRELAAGFLYQHFRHLDAVSRYHAELFYLAAFMEREDEDLIAFYTYHGYGQVGVVTIELDWIGREQLAHALQSQKQKTLLKGLWALSRETEKLSEGEQNTLFCLLAAGYSLAEKTLEDCPLTAQEAEAAFLKQLRTEDEGAWLAFSDSGEIRLEAREMPYRILLRQGGRERLPAGMRIVPRKIVALPHAQNSSGVSVTLHLFADAADAAPRVLTIRVGDYCYANFVENMPVWFHPAVQETESCRMERCNLKLRFTDKQTGQHKKFENPNQVEIIGFALEQDAPGWILLHGGGLDDSYYSRKWSDPVHKTDIVQVEFRGQECLLLDSRGTVYSNSGEKYESSLISLEGFRR